MPRRSASAAITMFSRSGQAGEELVDLVALGQAELADVGDAHAGDVAAVEDDAGPAVGAHLAGQHLEEGAFAGAVGADDAAQLALLDREVDVAVGDDAAERFGQAARLEHRAARTAPRGGGATGRRVAQRRRRAPSRGASSGGGGRGGAVTSA